MREIPIIKIPFSEADKEELLRGWSQVIDSGYFTLGSQTSNFEKLFCQFTGAKYAISVSNGTAALEVIIRALEIEGKSIIVPTNTFLASALAVAHSGNRVVFADSNPDSLSLDLEDVKNRIEEDTAAIMIVHIGGIITPQIDAIKRICEENDLFLIEDCAHAHGSTLGGRHAGLIGDAGGFSFFPTKTLTTGEGGMIITDNEAILKNALMLRNQGKNPEQGNKISELGHNWRMSEFTAVLGVQQMNKAENILADRDRIARYYDDALQSVKGIRSVPRLTANRYSHYKYICYLDPEYDRKQVKQLMKEKYSISLPGEVYSDLCHLEPIWDKFTYCGKQRTSGNTPVDCRRWPGCMCEDTQVEFPGSEYISRYHICLPMYPGILPDDLHYIVNSLDETLKMI